MLDGSKISFTAAVGQRLQQLRVEHGLSLSELARRAGVGKGTLSELETGARNPTLQTLHALTTSLGVPLVEVLPPADQRRSAAPTDSGQQTDAMTAQLLEGFIDADRVTELYRITIKAGRVHLAEAHGTGVTEHLTVFRGSALVGPGGAPFRVPAGSHARWLADTPHRFAALGPDDVEGVLLIRYPQPSRLPLNQAGRVYQSQTLADPAEGLTGRGAAE